MKRVAITGATRGLGFELAKFFAGGGWSVAGCGRSAGAGHPALAAPPHRIDAVDVADDSAVAAWAASVLADGTPDLVLNNAAIIARPARLWELSAADVDPVIDVNLKGTIHVIRHFAPAMIRAGKGVIVNFSSGWGRSTSPEVATYCATKWAVEGLTSALAQELPPGVGAVSLNPGIIATDMLVSCWGEAAHAYPDAAEWVRKAGPFIAGITASDNGRALTAP